MKVAFLLSMILLSPHKDSTCQLLPTQLRVTVVDGRGNVQEGATVSIYEREEDYRASANAIASAKTDSIGQAVFKNLKLITYFVRSREGERNNDAEGVVTEKLLEGRINKVNTIVE